MARASGLSVSTVQRIWRAFGLQPHRLETLKLSTDPDFVAKLRDLRITFAPALAGGGANPEIAKHNTRRLFQAGVPIALATGVDPLREMELLVDAGIPPLDAIVAGTRNGAAALQDTTRGTVQADRLANLILLSAHPGEDIRNLHRVALRIADGAF